MNILKIDLTEIDNFPPDPEQWGVSWPNQMREYMKEEFKVYIISSPNVRWEYTVEFPNEEELMRFKLMHL